LDRRRAGHSTYIVLNALGGGLLAGLGELMDKAPEKFDMILDKSNPEYKNLPGISVLIGGMWIANLYYWGTNQYIIQRALAAKSLKEAQVGTAFAGLIKILLPLIVVIPGIAAFVLGADIVKADEAYPWVLNNYVTTGFKGLAFAALIAAIGSSLSSMVNSTSTIFTLDIFKTFFMGSSSASAELDSHENDNPKLSDAEESKLVKVGKISAALSLIIGVIVAPLLGNLDQAFQFIQEYTGFISPGVVAVFLLGLFWKRASANSALWAVILSIPLSILIKSLLPSFPFMDRILVVFFSCVLVMVVISFIENKGPDKKAINYEKGLFATSMVFNIAAILITGILAVIYAMWW